ncbi:MAG: DUF4136 domain-containing protein [Gammaproteobacteria bacterium]
MCRKLFICCLLPVLLYGCANSLTSDIDIETEANPKVDLAGYKTYSWIGTATIVNDPEGRWAPPAFDADAEITYLINRELHARGMVETQVDPDMLVFYGAGIDMESMESKIDPDTDLEQMTNVPKGALTVILIDAESELAIWGGAATAEVKLDSDPEVVRKRLAYAIEKMFARLPK